MSDLPEDYCRSCTDTVHLVQGKWKMQILCSIRSGPVRLGQLRRELRTASKKVLTENLRELEDAGLVVRRDLGGSVRHVEYDFSGRNAIIPPVHARSFGRLRRSIHRAGHQAVRRRLEWGCASQ